MSAAARAEALATNTVPTGTSQADTEGGAGPQASTGARQSSEPEVPATVCSQSILR